MNALTNAEWEQRELEIAQNDRREIEALPLFDRKDNYNELIKDMQNAPETIAERAGWLLNGTYGHGQMIMSREAITSPDPVKSLFMLIALYEWRVPDAWAAKAWREMLEDSKDKLTKLIQAEVDWHNENERQIAEDGALKQAGEVAK